MRFSGFGCLIVTCALSGCGGAEPGPGEVYPGTALSFSLRGLESEPELSDTSRAAGNNVTYNSVSRDYVAYGSPKEFSLNALPGGRPVLIHLSAVYDGYGDAMDMVLNIGGEEIELDSGTTTEFVLLEFEEAGAGTLSVESRYQISDVLFDLKVVEPNRETLGLSKYEFLYKLNSEIDMECSNGDYTSEAEYLAVVNPAQGYISSGDDREEFNKFSENTMSNEYPTEKDKDEALSVGVPLSIYGKSEKGEKIISINPDTGVLSGTDIGESLTTGMNRYKNECTYTEKISGYILL